MHEDGKKEEDGGVPDYGVPALGIDSIARSARAGELYFPAFPFLA